MFSSISENYEKLFLTISLKNQHFLLKIVKNRKNFIYQDLDGNIITDIKANKLRGIISILLESKVKEFKKIKYAELADR